MHFETPFKMYKIIFFPENLKKFLGYTSKFRQGWVTLNKGIFVFGHIIETTICCMPAHEILLSHRQASYPQMTL